MPKTTCAISRADFLQHAQPVKVELAGNSMFAEVKEFATGSFGWYLSGKATIEVNGKPVQVQVGANLAIIGSKEAK